LENRPVDHPDSVRYTINCRVLSHLCIEVVEERGQFVSPGNTIEDETVVMIDCEGKVDPVGLHDVARLSE